MTHTEALTLIARNTLPCKKCHKPHAFREDSAYPGFKTWADPKDFHGYLRLSPAQFASEVLEGKL